MKNIRIHLVTLLTLAALTITACGGGGEGSGDSASATPSPSEGAGTIGDISFNISDALAVMTTEDMSAQVAKGDGEPISNLLKLTNSGEVGNIFDSDHFIDVDQFYIAPNGRLYITLNRALEINDESCVLFWIAKEGHGECVDSDLEGILNFDKWLFVKFPTQPVQFDELGNIYYAGYADDGSEVLRKYDVSSQQHVDLINENINIRTFLVRGDGSVFISGKTDPTDTQFLRMVSSEGTIANIQNGKIVISLFELPDGNIYFGDHYRVSRIVDGVINDTALISDDADDYPADFYIDDNDYDACDGLVGSESSNRWIHAGFCDHNGASISYYHRTPDDRFIVVNSFGDDSNLFQYWPTIEPIDTSILRPTVVQGTLDNLIVAGYDENNFNKLISYNLADGSEVDLLNGANIEIYHFSYSADNGLILFDGLRFSDNTYIVGSIDTTDGNQLTVLESGISYDQVEFFE